MSISIYYRAQRSRPLDKDELTAIDRLIAEWDTDRFHPAGGGSFCVYDRDGLDDGEVFAGSTKLPAKPEPAFEAAEHWASLLGMARRLVPDAAWDVSIDDHELVWDEETREYDLTQ